MTSLEASALNIYIDPAYAAFGEDKLFDLSDPILNRDGQLIAMVRLRDAARQKGCNISTADKLRIEAEDSGGDYYSMGLSPDISMLQGMGVKLKGCLLMEPPVVAPGLYADLSGFTAQFERVYIHNTHGDGYSFDGVRKDVLRKLYWPIPYQGVIKQFWGKEDRSKKIVMINGNCKPASFNEELYSKRIEALVDLAKLGAVDLYGRGWQKWWSRSSMWLPYWRHRRTLMSIYQGACASKYEVLSQYCFSLCFENMAMRGYITEKIFDCLYAGTIPLYLGAKDITSYIPEDCFIDCRKFDQWDSLLAYARSLSVADIRLKREAGRSFMESDRILPYYHSLENIMLDQTD